MKLDRLHSFTSRYLFSSNRIRYCDYKNLLIAKRAFLYRCDSGVKLHSVKADQGLIVNFISLTYWLFA